MILGNIYFYTAFLIAALFLSAVNLFAQDKPDLKYDFCSDNSSSWNNKVNVRDQRDITLPVRSTLEVDGRQNGSISVRGENRSDILVRACVSAWSDSKAEAQNAVNRIKLNTNSVITAENTDGDSWSVSYQVLVPRTINLKLTANNGGISINSVDGTLDFSTKNGGVDLRDLAGNVNGKTQNGGVKIVLSGNTWIGGGLNVETRNGGIKLVMPENYAANIETATVNGGFKSDIAGLQQPEGKKTWRNNRINTSLNGGGAPIRVVTINGGIKIDSF